MKFSGFYTKFYLLLCIVLFHCVSDISCASLELNQFSHKYLNIRFEGNYSRPKNLSELIEFTPMTFPIDLKNISVANHEESADSNPRVITLKLKTHLTVENNQNHHQPSPFYSSDEKHKNYENIPNLTDDSLSGVEYVSNDKDKISWDNPDTFRPLWQGYGRVEKLYTSKEEVIPYAENSNESKRSVVEEIPRSLEFAAVEAKSESDNSHNSKWLGYGRVEKIYPLRRKATEDIFPEEVSNLESEESSKSAEIPLTEDGIELENPDNWKWYGYEKIRKINKSEINETSEEQGDSNSEDISKSIAAMLDSENSEENKILPKEINRSELAKGRQFVFHPYIPYGKDITPDEKISFTDILPVKMVKFIKSMVEEAPWEQMFMKMVRMIVDQFVDKIIEKMFADKKDHLEKRSIDLYLSPSWGFPAFKTPVVRFRRSTDSTMSSEEDEDISAMLTAKRTSQEIELTGKKSPKERMTWLDHFLDFVFPNSKSNLTEEYTFERLKKRDTHNAQLFKILVTLFLNAYEKTSGMITDAKDTLRYRMLKEILPFLYQKRYTNQKTNATSNSVYRLKMSHRKLTDNSMKRNDILEHNPERSERRKRSTSSLTDQDEENRLWQSTSRRHKPHQHRSREYCSLRKACNAGRLLSRLPSVQDITLQLRSESNEPHWEALIWGMKKKRCSKIFCKQRQRSPKGSRRPWHAQNGRLSKNMEMVTEPPSDDQDETHS